MYVCADDNEGAADEQGQGQEHEQGRSMVAPSSSSSYSTCSSEGSHEESRGVISSEVCDFMECSRGEGPSQGGDDASVTKKLSFNDGSSSRQHKHKHKKVKDFLVQDSTELRKTITRVVKSGHSENMVRILRNVVASLHIKARHFMHLHVNNLYTPVHIISCTIWPCTHT